jgi:hypothetical protein
MNYYSVLFFILILHQCLGYTGEPRWGFTGGWVRDQGQSPLDPWPDPSNTYTPYAEVHPPKLPSNAAKYLKEACPHMAGMEVCCNDDQIMTLYSNFKTIDSLFGNCLLCSTNLKRFWCEFTCSPYQDYFVYAGEQITVEDVDFPVLNLTMTIGSMVACDLYESCKKNPYVTSLASGQSAVGFLEFMGSNAVQTGKTKIGFDFSNDPERSSILDMYACDMDVNGTLSGYKVEACTCNYWESAWKPSKANIFPAFFDGFNFIFVLIVYVSLIILSVIIYFVKKKWSEKHPELETTVEESQDYSFDTSNECSKKNLPGRINDSQYMHISKSRLLQEGSDP